MGNGEIRVLVIDDDEDDFFLLKRHLLEIPGTRFSIVWASSYDSGLKALTTEACQVCFVDYRLGICTGLDLLRQAIQDEVNIPLILLTGYGQHDVDLEAMRLGAADYLIKDQISPFLLEKTIRYAIYRFENLMKLKERETQILMQDRLASIGLLASSLAHEIGTPLGVIRGRAEYVSQNSGSDDSILKNMDVIISQIDRISKLIYSLLNLARGDHAKKVGEIQIERVVSDIIELMGHELKKAGIEIKNDLKEGVSIRAVGGAESLHQVVLNLVMNALHAIQSSTRQGRTDGHFIRFFTEKSNDMLWLGVEDSGCGISKENLRNLFKPFFTTKEVGSGTGLGLVTSYRIVESWGGTITVESDEGVGTVFRVSLPLNASG